VIPVVDAAKENKNKNKKLIKEAKKFNYFSVIMPMCSKIIC
jgi:hypothetical protein